MRVLGRGAAIGASFVILSSPPVLQRPVGGDTRAYVLATVALALVHAALAWTCAWRMTDFLSIFEFATDRVVSVADRIPPATD